MRTTSHFLNRSAFLHQKGMTLVEVLVSLVIFAIGLLGAAGLMVASLKSSQFTSSASTAMSLARDYGDLMQSFPTISSSSGTTNTFLIDTQDSISAPSDFCNTVTPCTPINLVNLGKYEWRSRLINTLPKGRAVICRDSQIKSATTGQYEWACDNLGDMVVLKIGWRTAAGNNSADTLYASDTPKLAVVLFGNQQEFVP